MTDILFMLTFGVTVVIGAVSLLWVILGARAITDMLINRLFRYISALILSLMAISLMFIVWVGQYTDMNMMNGKIGTTVAYSFILAICGLMFGSALAVKKISDMYGFKVRALAKGAKPRPIRRSNPANAKKKG